VHVGAAVDEAYEEAKRRGYEIVHPLIEVPWGGGDSSSLPPMATSSTW
jgi:hypothetical protein